MKKWLLLFTLTFLIKCPVSFGQEATDRQLWLLTAKITNNSTFRRDTVKSFMAGDKLWKEEKHSSGRSASSGTVTVVIENMADDPLNDFWFDSGAGDPKPMIVTGSGSSSHSSSYIETIDGKLIDGDKENGEVSGKALPEAGVMFNYTNDSKLVEVSIGIKGVANPKRQMFRDGEWVDYGGSYDYNIACSGGGEAPSANCKIVKTGRSYQASWKMNESKQRSTVDGIEYTTSDATLEVTIFPYKEPDKPEVTLLGCSDLGIEEQSNVIATGKPEGGKFRFWVEPGNLFNVEPDGESSANLTGATPGKGTLYVEYTTPEGKTNQTSQAASCVKIENYNNGQERLQIAFYDVDGKKKNGILTVPVKAQPANAAEMVKIEPSDPGILSAVGVGSEVTLQGLRVGTTTLQAKTNCGETTGPMVEVEVVNCDDETIARLEQKKKAAIENCVAATKDLQNHAGSKEFEKARDDLVSSTWELLAKTGLTIIANGKSPTTAIKVAAEIADKGAALSEIIASSNPEELKNNIGKTVSGEAFEKIVEKQFGEAIGEAYGKSLSALIGVAEVGEAANRFYENASQILVHEEVLKKFMENLEKADKDLNEITRRQQFCKNEPEKPKPQEKPKPDQPTKPKEPTPPTEPTPKTTEPPVPEPQTTEPTPEPETGDEVLVDPEPPTVPPRQVGLPYSPSECGCNQTKELTTSSAGFSALGTGIKNLSDCVNKFMNTSLADYRLALEQMKTLTDSLSSTLKSDAVGFMVKAKESKPRLDAIVNRVKSYDEAGNVFLKKMEKCPESVTTGMEIFQSVEKITVDSVKTNY
jgi:hypothetical protein